MDKLFTRYSENSEGNSKLFNSIIEIYEIIKIEDFILYLCNHVKTNCAFKTISSQITKEKKDLILRTFITLRDFIAAKSNIIKLIFTDDEIDDYKKMEPMPLSTNTIDMTELITKIQTTNEKIYEQYKFTYNKIKACTYYDNIEDTFDVNNDGIRINTESPNSLNNKIKNSKNAIYLNNPKFNKTPENVVNFKGDPVLTNLFENKHLFQLFYPYKTRDDNYNYNILSCLPHAPSEDIENLKPFNMLYTSNNNFNLSSPKDLEIIYKKIWKSNQMSKLIETSTDLSIIQTLYKSVISTRNQTKPFFDEELIQIKFILQNSKSTFLKENENCANIFIKFITELDSFYTLIDMILNLIIYPDLLNTKEESLKLWKEYQQSDYVLLVMNTECLKTIQEILRKFITESWQKNIKPLIDFMKANNGTKKFSGVLLDLTVRQKNKEKPSKSMFQVF